MSAGERAYKEGISDAERGCTNPWRCMSDEDYALGVEVAEMSDRERGPEL